MNYDNIEKFCNLLTSNGVKVELLNSGVSIYYRNKSMHLDYDSCSEVDPVEHANAVFNQLNFPMSEKILIEKLADKEHESWSNWMQYMLSQGEKVYTNHQNGVFFSKELIDEWRRKMTTSYEKLTEEEKESDRKEVSKILPIIYKFIWENKNE